VSLQNKSRRRALETDAVWDSWGREGYKVGRWMVMLDVQTAVQSAGCRKMRSSVVVSVIDRIFRY
jgi:hypothetical protein